MLPRSLKEVIYNMVYTKVVDVNKTIHIKLVDCQSLYPYLKVRHFTG